MTSKAINLTKDDAACPFCGADGEQAICDAADGEWAVECTRCGAMGPPMKDPSDAIDEWNHRSGAQGTVDMETEPP